jgi:hypothetical protein
MVLHSIRLAVLLTLCTLNSLQANSDTEQWFKKSTITITDLSEVPGMILEPGTYVLKAEESPGNSKFVIQLLNQDETQILASFIAVPDHRQRPDYDTVVTFFTGITEGPRPIQTWFYVGDMNGYEFVYPKARAKEIAKHTDDYVMAADSKDSTTIVAITPNGTEVPVYESKDKAADSSSKDVVTREKPQPSSPATPATNKTKQQRPKP